jgi:hypothetical protein
MKKLKEIKSHDKKFINIIKINNKLMANYDEQIITINQKHNYTISSKN